MLQDLARGRPTEIEAINGYVAARGAALGVPAPTNATLTRLIRARARRVAHDATRSLEGERGTRARSWTP